MVIGRVPGSPGKPGGVVDGTPSATAAQQDPGRANPPVWQTALRVAAGVVIAVVVIAVLREKMPDVRSIWAALRSANWWWVSAALGMELASIGMMIRQQHRLLAAFGVPVSLGRMGAITYSSTAISMSVPAGGAVSAGYVFRKLRASGASRSTAASVMLLSGLLSIGALVALYLAGLLLSTWTRLAAVAAVHPALPILIGIVTLIAIVVATRIIARRHRDRLSGKGSQPPPGARAADDDGAADGVTRTGLAAAVHRTRRDLRTALQQVGSVRPADWNIAIGTSLANWLLDALSLFAATRAFELRLDLWKLALLYLGIQVVRQIPLTPGGIGLIEASLLAGMVSAGAAQAPAAAAVVVYRLFSCWLLIPVGFGVMALLAARDRRRPAAPTGSAG